VQVRENFRLDAVNSRPILLIGAGGIVQDAHLPGYRKAGFQVAGICDIDWQRAQRVAERFGVEKVYGEPASAIAQASPETIFDIAIPPGNILDILPLLPDRSAVLIQKPMGLDIGQARAIRDLCRKKKLIAAVNFQLRFAPPITAAKEMIAQGLIGEVHEMEVRINVFTPWHLWPFLEDLPRVEIPMHSIHYLDLIRSFLGEPTAIWARTSKHPCTPKLASARSSMILDYGDWVRAMVTTNHGHKYGPHNQEAFVKWEGNRGAIKVTLGLLMDYPKGVPDRFEYCILESAGPPVWHTRPIEGSWFPDGFIGVMQSLMSFLDGTSPVLPTSVEDAYRTMELVEAAYQSDASGGVRIAHA